MKFFILFLIYEWVCNAYALTLLGYNYFLCATEECTFTFVLLQFTRIMTCLSVVFFLFTSSMLMNVIYGLLSGIGTIDRMKVSYKIHCSSHSYLLNSNSSLRSIVPLLATEKSNENDEHQ